MNSISAFEYISILVSIILALGITQLLSLLAEMMTSFRFSVFYLPHFLWVAALMFLHIQDWFVLYELKNREVWTLPNFFFIMLYPILLYCGAKLLTPKASEEGTVDYRSHFNEHFDLLFYVLIGAIFHSLFFNVYFLKYALELQLLLLIPAGLLFFLAIREVRKFWVHLTLSIVVNFGFLLSVIIEYNNWKIS